MKLLLAALLGSLAVAGGSPHVVARGTDGGRSSRTCGSPSRRSRSSTGTPITACPRARASACATTARSSSSAVSSPSEAVLDYYEIEGTRERRGGWWTLRPARPARFDGMALAATATGRRTLVADGRRAALWGGDAVHLRLAVER